MRKAVAIVLIAGLLCGLTVPALGDRPATPRELQQGLDEIAAMSGHTPIRVQIVQTSRAIPILAAAAWWREAAGDPRAYWDVMLAADNNSGKTIVAWEVRIVMLNAFGEVLTEYVGSGNRPIVPSRLADTFERVTLNESSGTLVKISLKRVKFSDGSVWVAK